METKDNERKSANLITRGLSIGINAYKWVKKLTDPDPIVRQHAVAKLKLVKDPCATSAVLEMMKDTNPIVRMEVAHYLGRKCDDTAVSVLKSSVKDPNSDVRIASMYALGNYKGEDKDMVLLLLKRGLYDHDREVKESSIEAIGKLGGEKAARIIALAIGDPEPGVREIALYTGSKTSMKVFQQIIIDALKDQDERVKESAKDLLVEHMNKTIMLKLVRLYAHSPATDSARKAIREVIEETNDNTGMAYVHALDHPTDYVQQHILASLDGKAKSLPALMNGDSKETEKT